MMKRSFFSIVGVLAIGFFLIFHYACKTKDRDANKATLLSDCLFEKACSDIDNYKNTEGLWDSVRLDRLIRYKRNQLMGTKTIDSAYLSQLERFVKSSSKDKSRKSFIKLFLARKYFDSSRVVSAKLCREILPVFQENKDTLAQILTLNQLLNVNYFENWPRLVGDKWLVKKYFTEIDGLALNSSNALYRLYGYYNSLRKGVFNQGLISKEKVDQAFKEGLLLIDAHEDFDYERQFFYRVYSNYCRVLGDYNRSVDYLNKTLELPNLVDAFLVYNDISLSYYGLKDYQKSLDYINLAITEYDKQNEKDFESKVWLHNHKKNILYEIKGDNAPDLVKYMCETQEMLNVIRNKNWDLMTYNLQVEYQIGKREQELIDHQQVIDYRKEQEQMTVYLITATFFIVLIFVLLLRIFRINKRLNDEMHIKTEIQRAISHDLLSPLLSLEIIIEDLKKKVVNDEKISSSLLLQSSYVNNIKGLCNNLINWLWVDRKGNLNKEYLKKSIGQCLQDLRPFFEANKCEVEVHYFFDDEELSSECNCTNVLIRNLLTNIVRHSLANKIILEVLIQNEMVYFKFYDNGNKMDKLLQKHIQDYINSPKKEFGSSLGLFLIKTFANKLNAKLLFKPSDREAYSNLQILKFSYKTMKQTI